MQSLPKLSALIVTFVCLALFATACSSDETGNGNVPTGTTPGVISDPDDPTGSTGTAATNQGVTVSIDGNEGAKADTEVIISLEEASGETETTVERETTVTGDQLDADGLDELLGRLPDLVAEETDQVDFNRPPETRPRPRPGSTIGQQFPPVGSEVAPTVESGPVEVLRFQPEGLVDLAPFISVTFNQPMVALSTVSQVEAADIPISITPEMPGRWIWLGTRTVRFEYEPGAIDRIPAATNYVVEVPAGATSASGSELAEGVRFEFSTPTAQVTSVSPMNNSLSTEPIFFIEFEQRIDPTAVLGTIDLEVDGRDTTIRLATGEEVNEDTQVAAQAKRALPQRWLAVRPVDALPTDASVALRIGPNVPSLEGPETSSEVSAHNGRTYGPFALTDSRCGYDGQCQPGQTFRIDFSNPIDTELFTADMVRVTPEIPGLRLGVSYDSITMNGFTAGQTDYDVTIASELTDIFGQELGRDERETFRVGDADRALFAPNRSLVTLDPIVNDQRLNVTSINNDELQLRVYTVDPATDWQQFSEQGWQIAQGEQEPQWNLLAERTITTGIERNQFGEAAIDLSAEFESSQHLVVVVRPVSLRQDEWRNQAFAVWVQNTKLSLDAITDQAEAVAWVTDLTSGDPVANARVTMFTSDFAMTDDDGVARLKLPARGRGMMVESNGDVALIGDFWAEQRRALDSQRWYVLDDRGIYKPGETANLKGWVRLADQEVPADLSLPRPGSTVSWIANDAFGNDIGSGEAELSEQGGFDLQIELPADTTLGSAGVRFSTNGFGASSDGGTWHELNVQEFRRPDFEVSTEVTSPGPHLAGGTFTVAAQADYFAGGSLASSPVDWSVTGSTSSYSPPGWSDFTFGVWVPWWFSHFGGFGEGDFFDGSGGGFGGGTTEFLSATTDASGGHDIAVTVDTEGKPRPVTISTSATVVDVTRQPISSSTNTLVHPAELYVGVRGGRTFVQPGERLDLEVIVTNIDGVVQTGTPVSVASVRLESRFENGQWTEVEVPDEACEVPSSDEPMVCSFRPSEGGRYRMTATVVDDQGRTNLTELTRWVAGGTRPTSRRVDLEELTLVPDAQIYQPGDTAEILVQSPFADANGLLVVTRGAIHYTETIDFDPAGTAVVQIPIVADDIPGIGLQFEVAGVAPRSIDGEASADLPPRPAFAAGRLTLSVPPDERQLSIDVAPRVEKLEPGADTQVDVAVTDATGEPVADAELAVIVIDEAVLSLTNYQLGDPLESFYQQSGAGLQSFRGRATLQLSDPAIDNLDNGGGIDVEAAAMDDEEAMMDSAGGDMAFAAEADGPPAPQAERSIATTQDADGEKSNESIELRTDFDALAVFEPQVVTNAEGKATIDIPMPDNLTRYRVMVIATADATNAGTGESNITARLPVTVRPTPPRFTNFGDVFEFPIIVQNATDDELEVDVALRSTNLDVAERQGTSVLVPANDRVEVRFEVAAVEAGVARYQVAASAGSFADAAEGEFPVYTPATAEAFATYGIIDAGSVAQPLVEPQDVFPQFGGLEISTSSTAVAALTDAMIYLSEYRYESSDSFASRIIAIESLDDILDAFDAAQLPSPDELRSVMANDIERLTAMQNDDGGFPYWRRGRESIPYNTVQATHALILAEQSGYEVNQQVLENAKWYLTNIEDYYPPYYSEPTRRAISAYALHVRLVGEDRDSDKAAALYRRAGDDIELDVAAWLWPVVADGDIEGEIELLLNNRVTETANAATFATSYGEQAWVLLHSDRRTDAVVLDALLSQRPDSDLVLKTLNGLLAARGRQGYWTNVQENSFVLLAAAEYFEQFEDADPDFVARAWLGETYALEHTYQGRTTDGNLSVVPMSELVGAGDTDIVVDKDGDEGRLYYRLGLRYAHTDFDLEPRDQGFVVQRFYEAIDDDADVEQNDDGTWTIKAGARVRVRLSMVADSRRTHVALIDPIPAGLEIVNPALATSEPVPQADPSDTSTSRYWWYQWFDHQNFRDDRAEAFSTWLRAGSYEYTYVARATTPGTFVTPPARAEQIYEPEVFGRSASTTVEVIDS